MIYPPSTQDTKMSEGYKCLGTFCLLPEPSSSLDQSNLGPFSGCSMAPASATLSFMYKDAKNEVSTEPRGIWHLSRSLSQELAGALKNPAACFVPVDLNIRPVTAGKLCRSHEIPISVWVVLAAIGKQGL